LALDRIIATTPETGQALPFELDGSVAGVTLVVSRASEIDNRLHRSLLLALKDGGETPATAKAITGTLATGDILNVGGRQLVLAQPLTLTEDDIDIPGIYASLFLSGRTNYFVGGTLDGDVADFWVGMLSSLTGKSVTAFNNRGSGGNAASVLEVRRTASGYYGENVVYYAPGSEFINGPVFEVSGIGSSDGFSSGTSYRYSFDKGEGLAVFSNALGAAIPDGAPVTSYFPANVLESRWASLEDYNIAESVVPGDISPRVVTIATAVYRTNVINVPLVGILRDDENIDWDITAVQKLPGNRQSLISCQRVVPSVQNPNLSPI